MNDILKTAEHGLFALVSYIPDPLASFLDSFRYFLPEEEIPRAHLTILPPRPLSIPVEAAAKQAKWVLQRFSTFEVELSSVQYFRETNFFYLDLSTGDRLLHNLHDALNSGDLEDAEQFEFRPHVTLCGPVPAENLASVHDRAEALWSAAACSSRFRVEEVVFLWLRPDGLRREWRRLWSHCLEPAHPEMQAVESSGKLTKAAGAGSSFQTW